MRTLSGAGTASVVLFLLVSTLSGCASMVQSGIDTTMQTLRYGKDDRTGLCYAMTPVEKGWSITNVPCAQAEPRIEADRRAASGQ